MKNLHWYYKFLILFLIFFSMFFLFNKNISDFANSSLYKYYVDSIFIPISSMKRNLTLDYKNLIKENNYLKQKTLKDNVLEEENNNLKEEIEKLKKVMDVKTTYTGYKTIYAKTIIRNKMYWYNTITIDKGSKDGVKKGQAVVGVNGLIGIVKNTTIGSSSVKLVTNNDTNYRISGMVKKDNEIVVGFISGYEYPYIKVSLASSSKNIKVGDKFYSYGLDNFPKNIYIGKIKKIQGDSYDLGSVLYVEVEQDMDDINYVVVLGN